MKALWINATFLDYRVPIYRELDRLLDGGLTLVYSKDAIPERVHLKAKDALGDRAIGLTGERSFTLGNTGSEWANARLRVPFQRGLLRLALDTEADVVICDGFFQWSPAAFGRRLVKRTPIVMYYEKTCWTERRAPWWRTGYRRCCLRAFVAAVVCNGILSKQYLTRLGIAEDRIVTGGAAADDVAIAAEAARLRAGCTAQAAYERPVFLYVGRLIPLKGVDKLLAGWDAYKQAGGAGSLVIVGDGPERPALEGMVHSLQLSNVHFLGYIDYDRIASVYAAADVFVIATLEDNWSQVIPEAMACGLPILCSKYNGCWPELVREGENGMVFDPFEPKDIVRCLQHCEQNQGELSERGERSRQIEKSFGSANAARATLQACELAVGHSA